MLIRLTISKRSKYGCGGGTEASVEAEDSGDEEELNDSEEGLIAYDKKLKDQAYLNKQVNTKLKIVLTIKSGTSANNKVCYR